MSSLASQCHLRHLCHLQLRRSPLEHASKSTSHVRSRSQVLSRFKLDNRPLKSHQRRSAKVQLVDESFADFPSLIEEDPDFLSELSQLSSSEGEESDDEYYVNPYLDVDLPASKKEHNHVPDAALAVAAHSLRGNSHGRKTRRIREGMILNLWLITFIGLFLLWFDWCSWRIVRLPLKPLLLTQPFIISTVISASAGFLYTPLLETLKIYQIIKKERSNTKLSYKVKPTMAGLFFIPIGVIVGVVLTGKTSDPVNGTIIATLAFGVVGFFDDVLRGGGRHAGLPGWLKLTIQASVGLCFCHWLDTASMLTPYTMKRLIPLPSPFGLQYLGSFYFVATMFCFLATTNGVTVTDGIDGLATGTAALAFLGLSVAVLALSPELAVFGSSMAGGCIGFLFHNRYKASIVMGQTGSMALGAALTAIASCSGMLFPLFIATGFFNMELFSIAFQVSYLSVTRRTFWFMRNISHLGPIHCRWKSSGIKDTVIVSGAYVLSCFLALLAGYVGLISS
ncbi:Phospho-N-acetylmuramoyl-pentapeptide-transferase [Rhynchospora pubera]|uniref:Phospho-N-acetylmuramoyl-pentapeptide-transferase n=1 Tax=Rhynchospora pubera TaxID=906938 RepID=A0AAV8EQQ1_9POAL|nr:Phospho-N-acetylmuramoyl-pentapeptide-transferase [Rhynchospora pubera]